MTQTAAGVGRSYRQHSCGVSVRASIQLRRMHMSLIVTHNSSLTSIVYDYNVTTVQCAWSIASLLLLWIFSGADDFMLGHCQLYRWPCVWCAAWKYLACMPAGCYRCCVCRLSVLKPTDKRAEQPAALSSACCCICCCAPWSCILLLVHHMGNRLRLQSQIQTCRPCRQQYSGECRYEGFEALAHYGG